MKRSYARDGTCRIWACVGLYVDDLCDERAIFDRVFVSVSLAFGLRSFLKTNLKGLLKCDAS